jgi:hypothetical protein
MHVLRDREFGEVVAEQGQFRPDAPAAPRRILPCHLADQVPNLGVKRRAAQNGGGLHDDETGPPTPPDP